MKRQQIREVTEEFFRKVSRELEQTPPQFVAMENHISLKTTLLIKSSKDYKEYKAHVKASHPPIKNSMREAVIDINKKLDRLMTVVESSPLFFGNLNGKDRK